MTAIFPLTVLSRDWIAAASDIETVGHRDTDGALVTAYHFPLDPDTGLPLRTTVVVAAFAAGEYAEHGSYSLATRLWGWRWVKPSAVRRALMALDARLDNTDTTR